MGPSCAASPGSSGSAAQSTTVCQPARSPVPKIERRSYWIRSDMSFVLPRADRGGGVRATRGFDVGETVMVGEARGTRSTATTPTRLRSAGPSGPGIAGLGPIVNHSCDPNCGCEVNETGACDFVARESIAAGDEITFDYAMRNYSIEYFPGGCLCGADLCRGSVTGWKDLSDDTQSRLRGSVAPYLLEIDLELAAAPCRAAGDGSLLPN